MCIEMHKVWYTIANKANVAGTWNPTRGRDSKKNATKKWWQGAGVDPSAVFHVVNCLHVSAKVKMLLEQEGYEGC